jgi:hypothetical protein
MTKHKNFKAGEERTGLIQARCSETTRYNLDSIKEWQGHKTDADAIESICKYYRQVALCFSNKDTAMEEYIIGQYKSIMQRRKEAADIPTHEQLKINLKDISEGMAPALLSVADLTPKERKLFMSGAMSFNRIIAQRDKPIKKKSRSKYSSPGTN